MIFQGRNMRVGKMGRVGNWQLPTQILAGQLTLSRGTSILYRNIEIPGPTQQLLCSKSHDFLAIFALAHSKINQIA